MKRNFKLLSMILAATMLFSACGGQAAAPAATPAPAAAQTTAPAAAETPAPATAETPAPEAAPANDMGTIEKDAHLVYWTMWNEAEPQGQVVAEAAAAFEKSTGVKMDVNFNGRDIRRTLEPALAANETIDLFDEDVDRVINNWGKYLLPLDGYVAASYADTYGKPYREVVNGTLVNLAEKLGADKKLEDGGKIHSIPYQPFIFTVMYNKDLFTKAGITEAPKTWDEFLAACEKLKASGVSPITVDDAYMPALLGYTLDRIVGADKCYAMVDNFDFSDPGVLKATQLWENMVKKGYISTKAATNVYPAGQIDEFAKSSVAMYLNGTWLPNEIKEQTPDLNWGSFAWPAIESTGDGIEAHNYGGQSFGVNKDTKYPNAAFAFIRWMTIGQWDQKLADASLGVPMANNATWPKQLQEAKTVLDASKTRLKWAAGMEDNPEIVTVIRENFSKLVSGSENAQQFADALKAIKKK